MNCNQWHRDHQSYKNKSVLRKQMKAMRSYAQTNHETDVQFMQQFVVPVSQSLLLTVNNCSS